MSHSTPQPGPSHHPPTALLVTGLAGLAALGQFASNIYIPSIPAIADGLGSSHPGVQATLAVFLAVFAIGQLIVGPISDRYGRRPVLFTGFAVFFAGTLICMLAGDLASLIVGRAIQGAGAAATIVMSRAITRDLFEGIALAKVMALIAMVFALVPGLTPLLGGALQTVGAWQWTFTATLVFAAVVMVGAFGLGETNTRPTDRLDFAHALGTYRLLLADARFRRPAVAAAFVLSAMAAFFAGSPVVFIDTLGISPLEYGLYPPIAVSGFLIGGIAVRRNIARVPALRFMAIGIGLMLVATMAMVLIPFAGLIHKHVFNATMVMCVTGLGIFLPVAISTVLTPFGHIAGSASALLGFLQMLGSAAGTVVTALILPAVPIVGFAVVMAASVVLAGAWLAVDRPRSIASQQQTDRSS